jgi:hypothetical protein
MTREFTGSPIEQYGNPRAEQIRKINGRYFEKR